MPARNLPPQLEQVGRQLLIGLGRLGGRAVAHAAKSVLDDGRRIATQAEERLRDATGRIDEFLGGEKFPNDRKPR